MPRPWVLLETSWQDISSAEPFDVAVLPWGATEAHNYHLPYGTDVIESEQIAAAAAEIAWKAGARVIVLPAVPFGVQSGQLDIPFCLHVNPSTQMMLLGDIARSLEPHGVRKLVILNGHGGNDFRAMIRELQPDLDIFLCVVNWYTIIAAKEYFDEPGDHAGEMETSLMMHLAPSLVLPLSEAGDGAERRSRITGIKEGWAWAPRKWTSISADTGVGDPRAASAAKGQRYFEAVTSQIGSFLVELASVDPDNLYE